MDGGEMSKPEGHEYIEPPKVNPGCGIGMREESVKESKAARPERRYIVFEHEDKFGWVEIMRMEKMTWDKMPSDVRSMIVERIRGFWG